MKSWRAQSWSRGLNWLIDVHSAWSSQVVTHPITNRGQCVLTLVNVPWSLPYTYD